MTHNDLKRSFSEAPNRENTICVACGDAAEVRLALLKGASQPSRNFCFSCGEAVIRDLRTQSAKQASGVLVPAAHQSFLRVDATPDDGEHGIIFWEGHAWSSDGPFAEG